MTWNPFRKYRLHPVIDTDMDKSTIEINPIVRIETEKAQLRSLKARTEITMLYENLAEQALSKIKGQVNDTIHQAHS